MTREEFRARIAAAPLLLDGATGTELAKQGMPAGVSPELWVLEHPEAITAVQQAYAAAGSQLVYAPTFGANPFKLKEFSAAGKTREINRILAGYSRRAVPDLMVFGDIAPTGQLLEPMGDLSIEEAISAYKTQIQGLLDGGVDGLAIETMMDLQEARAALIAARELCDLPVIVTMTFESGGRTLTGVDPAAALVTLQALGADAFGCNCSTGPREMLRIIRKLKPLARIPLVAKPNAGMPRLCGDKTVFDLQPDEFAAGGVALLEAGANLLGGCCGTSPAHLAALGRALRGRAPSAVRSDVPGAVSSSRRVTVLAPDAPFVLIGERINPTGKKALQAELRAGSLSMVQDFAAEQTGQGAMILDVNFGLSGIDSAETMKRALPEIMAVSDLPLCIDSTDPETVEIALRRYPGRALLNSISAEKARLENVLPIAAKYGAMLILLPLTDAGIPATAAEREAVLQTLLETAAGFGYERRDCCADALVMTVSADAAAPERTLELIEYCARELKIATVCGLSNVSYGLPRREVVNAAFLAMAMARGLTSAIANPAAPGIVDTVSAVEALRGGDAGVAKYLERFAAPPAPASVGDGSGLYDAVLFGRRGAIDELLEKTLATGIAPGEIVNTILIPALTEVGGRFERKEYYLPQLLQSASAMRAAMTRLEPLLSTADAGRTPGPVIVIATVRGDVHDIGKNIVSLLLKNHNFQVIDLGKDVPSETILAAVRKYRPAAVGLSALMTTTMPRMTEVVSLLRDAGFGDVPVIVGGAAVDAAFAAEIGAHYAVDAMASVRLAQQFTQK